MTESWNFWNSRIFDNWEIVETIEFMKDFKGIDQLGLALDELLVLIKSTHDDKFRLNMLKALQYCNLKIIPLFTPLIETKISTQKAFFKLFKLKDLLKYHIIAGGQSTLVEVAAKDSKKFNQAILSVLDA